MARQIIILALIFFAIVGMASAAKPAEPAPAAVATTEAAAEGPSDDIGTTDGNDDAAPVGGPVPAGAFSDTSNTSPSGAPGSSAASGLEMSTIAGVAAIAVGAAFFF